MKNIQEWLGHANYNTTADVYSHLDFTSKIQSGNVIEGALSKNADEVVKTKTIEELEKEIEELNNLLKLKTRK